MASWIGLTRINASFGTDALAGFQIAIRIILFALLPAWASRTPRRRWSASHWGGEARAGEQAVWRAGFYNLIFLGVAGLGFIVFAEPDRTSFFQGSHGSRDRRRLPAHHHLRVPVLALRHGPDEFL